MSEAWLEGSTPDMPETDMKAAHNKSGDSRFGSAARAGGRRSRADGKSGNASRTGAPGVHSPGSFAGHYGQLILADGVAPIPRALYLYQAALNLSPQQAWFISCVLSRKWNDGLPHPRLQELARRAALSLRQIKNIKNSLLQAGLLEVTPRYGAEGEQDANSYDFGTLFDRLESLIIAAPRTRTDREASEDVLADDPPGSEQAEGEALSYRSEEGASAGDSAITRGETGQGTGQGAEEEGATDYSFAARYGRIVLRRGVAAIPRALFTYQAELGLSPQQLWFIGYILSFQWSTELPYPSLRKMARNTGYSERQIHRIKDDLVRAGHLRVIERRGADGRDTTSAYDFGALLQTLNTLIRRQDSEAADKSSRPGPGVEKRESRDRAKDRRTSPQHLFQMPLAPLVPLATTPEGGEASVSGGSELYVIRNRIS